MADFGNIDVAQVAQLLDNRCGVAARLRLGRTHPAGVGTLDIDADAIVGTPRRRRQESVVNGAVKTDSMKPGAADREIDPMVVRTSPTAPRPDLKHDDRGVRIRP